MSLQKEIDDKAKEIQTDSYPMSIGELINMYRDEELEVHPEFQRFFRWSDGQKSKFIESILLGIPIPPIFVAQGEDGVWDVIDGLQRLSTILEFVGILKSKRGEIMPPSKLQATEFLPSLEGKVWDNPYDAQNSFTREQRINFKRAKLDINIIKRSSDKDAKYELFQRINSGGTKLSEQELRNCLLIMLDKDFYHWAKELCEFEPFRDCIPLSERLLAERYDMEMVMRFLVCRHVDLTEIKGNEDINDFITEQIIKIIEGKKLEQEQEMQIFKETFTYLNTLLAEDSFKKFDSDKEQFKGPFLISSFEALVVGVSENLSSLRKMQDQEAIDIIKGIYKSPEFLDITKRNIRPISRLKELTINSRRVFGE
ncbi:DUF262 domain-containing protein [Bacillus cereus]|uniref:DUF262 domain-containing protein n=1 Tax=Bacillus cereus TaxID=1396 RepID=UPI00397F5221